MAKNLLKLRYLSVILFFYALQGKAQCTITFSGTACVNSPISFHCNSVGSSNFSWDFNGEGSNNSQCDPSFSFSTPGSKNIKLSLKLFDGSTCNAQLIIQVKSMPSIKLKMISAKSQCFRGNVYCFVDSSTVPNDSICKREYVFDDGQRFTFTGNKPIQFCKSFADPAGGTYGITAYAYSCYGCVSSVRFNQVATVRPAFSLFFSSPQPRACDSLFLTVTNTSSINLDSLFSYEWDWGDGTKTIGDRNTPGNWKVQVLHKYRAGGNLNGSFDVRLSVVALNGCKDTFIYKDAGTIFSPKASIIASADSVCIANSEVSFSIKEGQILNAYNPLFVFETPAIPTNIARGWSGSHKFTKPGPQLIKLSFTSTIPGCARTFTDTILVIGPQAAIELGTPNNLISLERYQCTIKDTVHFTNFTRYYHNDKNFMDDDSVVLNNSGFNKPLTHVFNPNNQTSLTAKNQKRLGTQVTHFWDFGDEYCEQCTSYVANKVNLNKNCRYSRDQFPSHLYTDWELIYKKYYSAKPQFVINYNADSGMFYRKRIWFDDSVAIIRDTILYYGDNPWGLRAKDSLIFKNYTKKKLNYSFLSGIGQDHASHNILLYIPKWDTAFIQPNNGNPPYRYEGPRLFTLLQGQTLDMRSVTDTAFYIYYLDYVEDTVALATVGNRKIWKKFKTPGYILGDVIDSALNRQKFYESQQVHCFTATLHEQDHSHPLACSSDHRVSLALMPPSARHLRKKGYQCLSYDAVNEKGITYMLDDTKPGCTFSWAEINFSYNKTPGNWETAVGKNVSSGNVSMGDFPPVNPPFLTFPGSGAPGNRYSKVYDTALVDLKTGNIDVGLIVGNGIFLNGNYPQACQDTMIYKDFAHFPVLDPSFNIVSGDNRGDHFQYCKYDPVLMTPAKSNYSLMADVGSITYSITNVNAGKTHDKTLIYSVVESYKRFNVIHKDSNYLVDSLIIEKHRNFGVDQLLSRTALPIAKVTKWHTRADIGFVFDEFRTQLQARGINILDVPESQYAELIWNNQGVIGQAYTGAKGLVDTAGFGHQILFTTIADNKITLHPRDTGLTPLENHIGQGGKSYASYLLKPEYAGFYTAEMTLRSAPPFQCSQSSAQRVVVGFYMNVGYEDTLICPGNVLVLKPYFRYYNVYPDIMATNCPDPNSTLLDCVNYWMNRLNEAGNPKRESYTKTDLNKDDDNVNDPKTIFGSFPYSITGLDNLGQTTPKISIDTRFIYRTDTGRSYVLRTAAADSNGCRDTFTQSIYLVMPKAKFSHNESLNGCNLFETLQDQTTFQDPLKTLTGKSSDKAKSVSIEWGDKSLSNFSKFFYPFPQDMSHTYERNGNFKIYYYFLSDLGCTAVDSFTVHKSGPVAFFDTTTSRSACRFTKLKFNNLSTYTANDSCIWAWDFGDNSYAYQYGQINSTNNPLTHSYSTSGNYKVNLSLYYKSQTSKCQVVYPDINFGEAPIFVRIKNCDSTAVDEHQTSAKIRMFPNPANNTVSFETQTYQEIQIINNLGQIVATIKVDGLESFDFSYLSSGLYIVKSLDQIYIGKLIINHNQ